MHLFRSEEHTSELQSHHELHTFPTRRSSDLLKQGLRSRMCWIWSSYCPPPMSEQDYRPGSLDDFDRLYRSSYNRVLYTLYGILGDQAAAEDCTHDAFVQIGRAHV